MPAKGQTEVTFNDEFFAKIMKSAQVVALTKAKAEEVLKIAQSTAPVDTGAYRDGLAVQKLSHEYRDTFMVEGADPKTLLIEAKTGNLARALKAAK